MTRLIRGFLLTVLVVLALSTQVQAQVVPTLAQLPNCSTQQSVSSAMPPNSIPYSALSNVWLFDVRPGDIIVAENESDQGAVIWVNINNSGTAFALQPHSLNSYCAGSIYSLLTTQAHGRAFTANPNFIGFFMFTVRPAENGGFSIIEATRSDYEGNEATGNGFSPVFNPPVIPPVIPPVDPPPPPGDGNGNGNGNGGGNNGNGNGNGGGNGSGNEGGNGNHGDGNNGDNGNHGDGNNGQGGGEGGHGQGEENGNGQGNGEGQGGGEQGNNGHGH